MGVRAKRFWEKVSAWESWVRSEVQTRVQRALQKAGVLG